MTWIQRALKVCDERKITRTALARACSVALPRIRQWELGEKEAYARQVRAAASFLGVSLDWLMTGEGSTQPERLDELTEEERLILQAVKRLNLAPLEALRRLMAEEPAARVVATRTLPPPASSEDEPKEEGPRPPGNLKGHGGKPGRK